MRRPLHTVESFAEKDFYLNEFHDKSLLFACRMAHWRAEPEQATIVECFATLLQNATRLILLLETSQETTEQQGLGLLLEQLAQRRAARPSAPVLLNSTGTVEQMCLPLWDVLRTSRLVIGTWPADAAVSLARGAQRIAVGLRVYKLVYLDPLGGLTHDGTRLSFLTGPALHALLHPEHTEATWLAARRPVLEAMDEALAGGVTSASLCALADVEQELLTYEGGGTLFTRAEYCQIEKLGIDDFHEVETLLDRAEQAGYLKPRTPHETARLLLHGYSARLGPASMEPAGFCALLPYDDDNAAEIAGLFTITRYQGEGVGGRLVEALVQEAQRQRLTYIFACTTQPGAQRLFTRHGFQRVASDAVAAAKWQGYDPERRARVAVYRRDLTPA